MKVLYRGNHMPGEVARGIEPWSTEHYVAEALEQLGHEVVRNQEDADNWADTVEAARGCDLFLWTSTYGMAHRWDQAEARAAVGSLSANMPTAALHLDRFHGLDREDQVRTEPWFRLGLVATADGGADWAADGVNHWWLVPAVSRAQCLRPARFDRRYAVDVAFVGSDGRGYHQEWSYRAELVAWLQRTYRHRFGLWPGAGRQVRTQKLADLYASARIIVGDSCLAGGARRYWSDRIPETVGRRAFLIHPAVEGLAEHYTDGEHLRTYELGDWAGLAAIIEGALVNDEERRAIAERGQAHVLMHHTWEVRLAQMLDAVPGLAVAPVI